MPGTSQPVMALTLAGFYLPAFIVVGAVVAALVVVIRHGWRTRKTRTPTG